MRGWVLGNVAWGVAVVAALGLAPDERLVVPIAFAPWALPGLGIVAATLAFYRLHRATPSEHVRPWLGFVGWLVQLALTLCVGALVFDAPPLRYDADAVYYERMGYIRDSVPGVTLYRCDNPLVCTRCDTREAFAPGVYVVDGGHLRIGGLDVACIP